MNRIYALSLAIVALVGMSALQSCSKDAELQPLTGQAYFAQTLTRGGVISEVKVADGENASTDLNVRLSDVAEKDATFSIVVDEDVLKEYNERTGSQLVLLPEELRSLSTKEVTIKAGASISEAIRLSVQSLTDELKNTGNKYAVPLRLECKDGDSSILPGGSKIIYTLTQVLVRKVPVLGTYNGYRKGMVRNVEPVVLDQWTLEFRVNMNGFRRNNQAVFGSWGGTSPTGNDSEIYCRFGDAPTPYNTLQVKFAGTQFDRTNMVFTPNTWYHVAIVFDGTLLTVYVNGQKDLDTDKIAGKQFVLGRDLHIAGSGGQWFVNAMMMQELRFWSVARTPAQLVENEHTVSPYSPGLLHYWRMDEGEGNILKNQKSETNPITIMDGNGTDSTPSWMDNVRSDGKGRTAVD